MMRSGMTVIGLYLAGMLLVTTACVTSAPAEPSGPVNSPTDMAVLELLRAEVLDTVSLDRPVHFTTPEATDTVAWAGTYRVEAGAPSQMTLVAVQYSTAMLVNAPTITHEISIAEPIALYVRDDEKIPTWSCCYQVARGSTRGSYDGSRARELRILPLTRSQIQQALQGKEREKRDVWDGRQGGVPDRMI